MFLVIDNYDSFVHNLARYVERAGGKCKVVRNDALSVQEIKTLSPTAIILSPGPKTPKDAGICVELVKQLGSSTPILGICLGHQAIGEAYEARTIKAQTPVHGKASAITHEKTGLFKNIPSPMQGARYHSLITALADESPLIISAKADNGEIMAMHHNKHPVYGLQFHPESVLTENGQALIENFKDIALGFNKDFRVS